MRKTMYTSWACWILAISAVLLLASPGLVKADGGLESFVPKSSVLIGPSTVAPISSANYVLRVTFTNGVTADYPGNTGQSFSAVNGSIDSNGDYNNTSGVKDRITGILTQRGVTTTATKIISIK